MRSLQKNLSDNNTTGQMLYETMFVWNEFLTREIRNNLQSTSWTIALVHGFFKQVCLKSPFLVLGLLRQLMGLIVVLLTCKDLFIYLFWYLFPL